jgi:hypothetical protein
MKQEPTEQQSGAPIAKQEPTEQHVGGDGGGFGAILDFPQHTAYYMVSPLPSRRIKCAGFTTLSTSPATATATALPPPPSPSGSTTEASSRWLHGKCTA